MSRRWYRFGAQVVFVGWEPAEQAFYLNVVDLCHDCGGTGEIAGSEEVCPGCGGEGIQLALLNPSHRQSGLSLDDVGERLKNAGVPFPDFIRADLQSDERSNAGALLHEYDVES
jgi:hypothetical protein